MPREKPTQRTAPEAFILFANGTRIIMEPREPTLEELQAIVGGYIQVLNIRYGVRSAQLIFNEDGKGMGLAYNSNATLLARTTGIAPSDFIVGDAVVLVGPSVMIK